MDTVTLAIATAVLTKLCDTVIKDAYEALKAAIVKKWGKQSDLAKAIVHVEEKPDSTARKEVLKEEVAAVEANKDAEIIELAQTLLTLLKESADQPASHTTTTIINQEGRDNALQIGQVGRDVDIKR